MYKRQTLLFLIPADADDIKQEYQILLNELKKYNPELLDKERILGISKCDMLDEELTLEIKKTLPKEIEHIFFSSIAEKRLSKLKDKIWSQLNF